MKLLKIFRRKSKKELSLDEKITEIIDRHLEIRDKSNYHYKIDDVHKVPTYVVAMCQEVSDIIPNSSLEDIISIDQYNAGSIDYFRKFILHCMELNEELQTKSDIRKKENRKYFIIYYI